MRFNFAIPAPLFAFLLVGCSEEIEVYEVPREEEPDVVAAPMPAPPDPSPTPAAPPASGMTMLPGMAEAAQAQVTPFWSAPDGWVERPPSGVRKGDFGVPGSGGEANLTVTVFPGDVGGLVANINRWRQQLGLPPAETPIQPVTVDGLESSIVYIESADNARAILGAIVPQADQTWFFKMMGPRDTVSAELDHFVDFMGTVDFP